MNLKTASSVCRRVILGAALAATGTSGTLATDLPAPIPAKAQPRPLAPVAYFWSGLYIGGHLGHLWARTRVEDNGVAVEQNARTNGVIGGAMIGYNWQIGPAAFGIEGDFGWTDAHGVGSLPGEGGDELVPVITRGPNSYDVRWASHARGRIGYAFQNLLVFAAGGLAIADLKFTEGTITTSFVPASASGGKYYGWSIGGGVEWGMAPNLVSRVEYFYDNHGHKDYVGVLGDPYRVSLTGQTMRGAVAWKLNP
jgi:opacity protein-like surface antigen